MTRHLTLVPPVEDPGRQSRAEVTAYLRELADLIDTGQPVVVRGQVYDPVVAAVIIPFTAEGEPFVVAKGFRSGLRTSSVAAVKQVLSDAASTLTAFANVGDVEEIRARWRRSVQTRARASG